MPPFEEFLAAFKEHCDRDPYEISCCYRSEDARMMSAAAKKIGNHTLVQSHRIIRPRDSRLQWSFTAEELYQLIGILVKGSEEGQSFASGIMSTLGFEWI